MAYHVSADEFERIAADALESIPPALRARRGRPAVPQEIVFGQQAASVDRHQPLIGIGRWLAVLLDPEQPSPVMDVLDPLDLQHDPKV